MTLSMKILFFVPLEQMIFQCLNFKNGIYAVAKLRASQPYGVHNNYRR